VSIDRVGLPKYVTKEQFDLPTQKINQEINAPQFMQPSTKKEIQEEQPQENAEQFEAYPIEERKREDLYRPPNPEKNILEERRFSSRNEITEIEKKNKDMQTELPANNNSRKNETGVKTEMGNHINHEKELFKGNSQAMLDVYEYNKRHKEVV